jgi:uncharacterized protein YndB with AHSA1/START domain
LTDFEAQIRTPWAATRVFDYIVDFRNLAEWHAAVKSARLQTLDPGMRNARYSLRAKMAGRRVHAKVTTLEAERPKLIVASATNPAAETTDRFEIETQPEGDVLVCYTSEMRLKTPVRVIGPLMIGGVKDAWQRSAASLAERLEATGIEIR